MQVMAHAAERDAGSAEGVPALVVLAGSRLCAIAARDVAEIMRPLAVDALPAMPAFVLGVSVIRGVPVPVVDLSLLLGASGSEGFTRFVALRLGERCAALAVSGVLGVRRFNARELDDLPPLLRDTSGELVEALGASDERLLVLLRGARVVPDEAWHRLEARAASR